MVRPSRTSLSSAHKTSTSPEETNPPLHALQSGDHLAERYELLHLLGRGGFGDVWCARNTQAPGQAVAIKILHPWRAQDAESLRRFEREARALATARHEHIVTIHEYGVSEGRHYLVMELVEGRTLRNYLNDGSASGIPPTMEWVREVFGQICISVAAMHTLRRGGPLVHRDLKPDNIMVVSHPNKRPFVKILDLGLARLGQREFTQTGSCAGTPEYMAPEQLRGVVADIVPSTDVFSLAVILFELLTLQCTPEPTNQWWALVMSNPRAVYRALQALPVSVPNEVLAVLASSLDANPAKRPANARIFHARLEHGWNSTQAHWRIVQHVKRWISYRILFRERMLHHGLMLVLGFALAIVMLEIVFPRRIQSLELPTPVTQCRLGPTK